MEGRGIMADVGIRPLDLPEASAVAETDKIMVTNTAGATKVATAETLFKNSSKTICLTRAEYNALTEKKQDTMYVITDESVSGVTVDQTFNGSSANPQSGVAINGALTNVAKIKKLSITKTFSQGFENHWYCALENLKVANHLILGVKVKGITGGTGTVACIGLIPYRYNGYPSANAIWGLIAIQETGKSLLGIEFDLEIVYIDVSTTIL